MKQNRRCMNRVPIATLSFYFSHQKYLISFFSISIFTTPQASPIFKKNLPSSLHIFNLLPFSLPLPPLNSWKVFCAQLPCPSMAPISSRLTSTHTPHMKLRSCRQRTSHLLIIKSTSVIISQPSLCIQRVSKWCFFKSLLPRFSTTRLSWRYFGIIS